MGEDGLDVNQETFSTASYGYCAQALHGRICHHGIHLIKRAIVGSKNGSNKAFLKKILTELAENLYERGRIDIRETFIDGSFTPAKKGALLSAIPSEARAPRSWQLQTLLVFLSPVTYKALHPTK